MRIKKFRTLLGVKLGLIVTKVELKELKENNDFIDMKTAQGDITPWLPSQADILTNDWMRVR